MTMTKKQWEIRALLDTCQRADEGDEEAIAQVEALLAAQAAATGEAMAKGKRPDVSGILVRASRPVPDRKRASPSAIDLDVRVAVEGNQFVGEVSLIPRRDGGRGFEAYGTSPDHWVSRELLQGLQRVYEGDDEGFREALDAIEGTAAYVAARAEYGDGQ